jgi:hypothetical protein
MLKESLSTAARRFSALSVRNLRRFAALQVRDGQASRALCGSPKAYSPLVQGSTEAFLWRSRSERTAIHPMRTLDSPRVAIPARAGGWMNHASDETIAIILGNDLVSRERADAACSRVWGFGKTKADLLAPMGIRPSLTDSATLTPILAVRLLQTRKRKAFCSISDCTLLWHFRTDRRGNTYASAFAEIRVAGGRRAGCSGRPAAFLFCRCYSGSEACNFNRLHLISPARTRGRVWIARTTSSTPTR